MVFTGKLLTFKRRVFTIHNWTVSGEECPGKSGISDGEQLPGAMFRSKLLSDVIINNPERLEVKHISKREKIKLPKWHCKVCHYSWFPNDENPPIRCANISGYVDKLTGNKVESCSTRTWTEWPDSFKPETCQCKACLQIYYDDMADAEELARERIKAVK